MSEARDDKRGVKVDAWKLYSEAYSDLFPNARPGVLSPAALQEMVDRMLATGGVIYQALASTPSHVVPKTSVQRYTQNGSGMVPTFQQLEGKRYPAGDWVKVADYDELERRLECIAQFDAESIALAEERGRASAPSTTPQKATQYAAMAWGDRISDEQLDELLARAEKAQTVLLRIAQFRDLVRQAKASAASAIRQSREEAYRRAFVLLLAEVMASGWFHADPSMKAKVVAYLHTANLNNEHFTVEKVLHDAMGIPTDADRAFVAAGGEQT